MPLVVIIIGAVFLVVAMRGTYGQLFADLSQDVPKFLVWAAAIVGVGAIQFVPGFRNIGRALLGLVIAGLIVRNYSQIIAGFKAVAGAQASAAPPSPAQQFAQQTQGVPPVGEIGLSPQWQDFSSAGVDNSGAMPAPGTESFYAPPLPMIGGANPGIPQYVL